MQITTPHGSSITRSSTFLSLSGFESCLNDGWSFLVTANAGYEATFVNRKKRSLITYCEGDIIEIESPNESVFTLEQCRVIDFAVQG